MLTEVEVDAVLRAVPSAPPAAWNELAASLSKVAAKAEDAMLLKLGSYSCHFVGWLESDQPLVKAYTACILANIAFLEAGQDKVLEANGVRPLVALIKAREDKKVTLHATAAIQNITYKNTQCCHAVIENGGEKALKKLLQHKSDDIQQFAAGAMANLQLYRRGSSEDKEEIAASTEANYTSLPSANGQKKSGESKLNRKVKNILRRRSQSKEPGDESSVRQAAVMIQAAWRAQKARKEVERRRRKPAPAKGKKKYGGFNVSDVRNEIGALGVIGGEGLPPLLRKLPGPEAGRKPLRLAPLARPGGLPSLGGGSTLPPLPISSRPPPASVATLPRMGHGAGLGAMPPVR